MNPNIVGQAERGKHLKELVFIFLRGGMLRVEQRKILSVRFLYFIILMRSPPFLLASYDQAILIPTYVSWRARAAAWCVLIACLGGVRLKRLSEKAQLYTVKPLEEVMEARRLPNSPPIFPLSPSVLLDTTVSPDLETQ